jgi:hypothetical protein
MPYCRADRAVKGSTRSAAPIEMEVSIIGNGLGMEPSQVQARLQEGKISTLCERGIGEDEGRYRLTFYFGKRRLRLVIDTDGSVTESA